MLYRLRTLLIILALGPPVLAGIWFGWKRHVTTTRQLRIKQLQSQVDALQSRYDALSARIKAASAELERLKEQGHRLEGLSIGATTIPVKKRVLPELRFSPEVERAMLLDATVGE